MSNWVDRFNKRFGMIGNKGVECDHTTVIDLRHFIIIEITEAYKEGYSDGFEAMSKVRNEIN